MAAIGAFLLVKAGRSYWLVNARRRPVDWWRLRVIRVIRIATLCAEYAHRGGGHEGQKMRLVWAKRGLYWRITCFRARGEYMIRLDRLNKYSLFRAHGRRDVRTPVHAWGAP
jgi:hypothetical protein